MRLRLLPKQASLNTWPVWPLRNAAFWAMSPLDVYGANAWNKWGADHAIEHTRETIDQTLGELDT